MKNITVIGTHWGDEGKGRVVDYLSSKASLVVRFQGGHNAGHTICVGEQTLVLHLIPSGILNRQTQCLIGHGVVLSPSNLEKEIQRLEQIGVEDVRQRLRVAGQTPLLLPYHVAYDACTDMALGAEKIGTTKRGIGPAYQDKVARKSVRLYDLYTFDRAKEKALQQLRWHNAVLADQYDAEPVAEAEVLQELAIARDNVLPLVDAEQGLLTQLSDPTSFIVFEGAQGAWLDLDFGSYPYVTSSNTCIGGLLNGCHINHRQIDKVLGVTKAYTTRVGEGPFPVELNNDIGQQLLELGGEYGATTARPRRCGWLDIPMLRRSIQKNAIDFLCMTKLDVLNSFATVQICHSYRCDGQEYDLPSDNSAKFSSMQPIYKELPGWQCSLEKVKKMSDLPEEAKNYIRIVEEFVGIPIALVSISPDRDRILLAKGFKQEWGKLSTR